MIRELINKLKTMKHQLQKYNTNNATVATKPIEKEKEIDIKISKQDNIFKIEINDYISIVDFINKRNSSDEYSILDLLCNGVLWNGKKQKVNKGTYYVINTSNCLYNILFTDETIDIEERIKLELDGQTQKENIIQDRIITFKVNKDEYNYFSAKHESNGNTYYTKYYSKDKRNSFKNLELTEEAAYEEIASIISNLEAINGITNILDIELLKEHILEDLIKKLDQRKTIL